MLYPPATTLWNSWAGAPSSGLFLRAEAPHATSDDLAANYFFLLATLSHVANEPHRPDLSRRAYGTDGAGVRPLVAGSALAVVRRVECGGDGRDFCSGAQAARGTVLGVRARLAARSVLHHGIRGGLVPVAGIAGRVAERFAGGVGSGAVRGASGGVVASLLVVVVARVAGVRLLQFLSALSRGCGSIVGVATPGAIRGGVSAHDRRAQRGLRGLLCHLPAVPHAQSISQCGTSSRGASRAIVRPVPPSGELHPEHCRGAWQRLSQRTHHAGLCGTGVRGPLFPVAGAVAAAVQPADVRRRGV